MMLTETDEPSSLLLLSGEALRCLFESAPDASYLMDLAGRFVDGNRAAEKLIGYRREELIGKNFVDAGLLAPDQVPAALAMLKSLNAGESLGTVQLQLQRRDGRELDVEVKTQLIQISGQMLILGSLQDITDRKQAEEGLRKLAAIVESSDDAVVATDLEGVITSWNRGAETIYGYSAKEAIGQSIGLIIPAKYREELTDFITKAKADKSVQHYETVRRRKNETEIDVSLTISPIHDQEGKVCGFR